MTTNIQPNRVGSVYETIDAAVALKGSASGKTVLVTGAGRGMFTTTNLKEISG